MNELNISVTLPTKENIGDIAMRIVNDIREGRGNPLELLVQLAALEKVCEIIRENVQEQVLNELAKENGKVEILGAKVERKEVGTKWTYDNEAWKSIKTQEEGLSERRKSVEKICQNIPEGTQMNWTDESTGETYTLTRGAKSSKTSFAITLGK